MLIAGLLSLNTNDAAPQRILVLELSVVVTVTNTRNYQFT